MAVDADTLAAVIAGLTKTGAAVRPRAPWCRAMCKTRLDPQLVDSEDNSGLHMGCEEPAPVPVTHDPSCYRCSMGDPCGGNHETATEVYGTGYELRLDQLPVPAAAEGVAPAPLPPSTVAELRDILIGYDASRPRSMQVRLGPSELGTPCQQQIARKLAGAPRRPVTEPQWAPFIGTAVHASMEDVVAYWNKELGRTRWLAEDELSVDPGMEGVEPIRGHGDAFDLDTSMVVDWKGLSLDTPLPTPTGWTTMGAVPVGDQVLGANGKPCTVIGKSPVFDRPCYRVTFEDGSTVVTDNVHQWPVLVGAAMRPFILSTEQAREQLFSTNRTRPQRHLRVATTAPLDLPHADLPVQPYTLGAWIGDGSKNAGTIGKPDAELFDHIRAEGYEVSAEHRSSHGTRTVYGLIGQLRAAGVLGHKAIPAAYLRASTAQRLALLQGLMDTDGTWNKIRSAAVFTSKEKALAEQVAELAHSLGWKARVFELTKHGYGLTITAYDVVFTPHDLNPFRLSRKADLVRLAGSTRSRRRIIRSVEPTVSVPTQCIEVDSPDHTYLCGDQMIPTHNCTGVTALNKLRAAKRAGKHPAAQTSAEYRTQAHLYGLGHALKGRDVRWVRLVLLARSWKFDDSDEWTEAYDPGIAYQAIARYYAIHDLLNSLDVASKPDFIAAVPATPGDSCGFCPFKRPGQPTNWGGCAGDTAKAGKAADRFAEGLIA